MIVFLRPLGLRLSRDCMRCGRCVDVCSEDVFTITTRWSSGAKS
ncbi:4Fe-4S binding protein [Pseudomonas aeruginosa]